jgi:hypothetical protein
MAIRAAKLVAATQPLWQLRLSPYGSMAAATQPVWQLRLTLYGSCDSACTTHDSTIYAQPNVRGIVREAAKVDPGPHRNAAALLGKAPAEHLGGSASQGPEEAPACLLTPATAPAAAAGSGWGVGWGGGGELLLKACWCVVRGWASWAWAWAWAWASPGSAER